MFHFYSYIIKDLCISDYSIIQDACVKVIATLFPEFSAFVSRLLQHFRTGFAVSLAFDRYYKTFYKQGLLTAEQLERLIEMNTAKTDNADDNNDPAA